MSLQFIDRLPPDARLATKYEAVAEQLRANPGKWAVLPHEGKSPASVVAGQYRSGRIKSFPKGEFQFASRGDLIYVRYIGGAA